ncbi:MAG: hypothetical protein KAI90_03235, partial [Desulfobulbaceae bacterium]|nr:hypothetical protein [Desulfobulbaceae bacterium]
YEGHGVLTWRQGIKYAGEFLNDRFHGQGVMELPNGSTYVGEWNEGLPNGKGTYTYQGEKNRDERSMADFLNANGPGRLRNNWQYKGEWKNGSPDGHGALTFPDGEKRMGQWKDGEYCRAGMLLLFETKKTQKVVLMPRQVKRVAGH